MLIQKFNKEHSNGKPEEHLHFHSEVFRLFYWSMIYVYRLFPQEVLLRCGSPSTAHGFRYISVLQPESSVFLRVLGFNQNLQLPKFRHLQWWLNLQMFFVLLPISSHALVTHRDSFGLCNWCKSRIIFLESLQDIIVSEIINISFYVYKWSMLALEFEGELNSIDLKINRELQNLKHLC